MKKFIIIFISVLLISCNATKKTSKTASENNKSKTYSFKEDVLPIFQTSCSPCHSKSDGKHIHLEDYMIVVLNIDDIITRIQLPTTDEKFMPFKSKKPPLTEQQIKLIKDWTLAGMQD